MTCWTAPEALGKNESDNGEGKTSPSHPDPWRSHPQGPEAGLLSKPGFLSQPWHFLWELWLVENPTLLPWALLGLRGSGNEVGVAGKKDKVIASSRNQAEKKNKGGKACKKIKIKLSWLLGLVILRFQYWNLEVFTGLDFGLLMWS